MKNALLVYPKFPPSYWSFEYALRFVGKCSATPPLGLLTIAALFPEGWNIRLVDMNVEPLTDEHLKWASYVFTSTMVVQQDSFFEVVRRCRELGRPLIAGGPHPTSYQEEIEKKVPGQVAHFFSGEAEEIFADFLADLLTGKAGRVYTGPRDGKKVLTDIKKSPVPRFELLNRKRYASMAVQFTRGCPLNCEFCDITKLFGRVVRIKTNSQILAELQFLYDLGWRRSVMFVDDNFIGNKAAVMRLLPDVTAWQKERGYPDDFYTEATVDLPWHEGMLGAMREAGFSMVFLGIESPNASALKITKKPQNLRRGESAGSFLFRSIRKIQGAGIEVSGGFIVGLDGDEEFGSHLSFIEKAGIPMAMAGLLAVVKGTDLWRRLEEEGRLLGPAHSGDNTSIELNFVPELPREVVLGEYKRLISALYDPPMKNYFERCWTLIKNLGPTGSRGIMRYGWRTEARALFNSIRLQVFSRQGPAYLRFLARVLESKPERFSLAVRLAINGYHFEKITRRAIALHDFGESLESEKSLVEKALAQLSGLSADRRVREAQLLWQDLSARLRSKLKRADRDFRDALASASEEFLAAVRSRLEQLQLKQSN